MYFSRKSLLERFERAVDNTIKLNPSTTHYLVDTLICNIQGIYFAHLYLMDNKGQKQLDKLYNEKLLPLKELRSSINKI